jgi:hypothetical protein
MAASMKMDLDLDLDLLNEMIRLLPVANTSTDLLGWTEMS